MVLAEVIIVGRSDPMLAWYGSYPALLLAVGMSKVLFKEKSLRGAS
jgi:hypothetical protein